MALSVVAMFVAVGLVGCGPDGLGSSSAVQEEAEGFGEADPEESLTIENPPENVSLFPVDEAFDLVESGAAFVLDARSLAEFDSGHIPGSTNMPSSVVSVRLREVPVGKTVLVVTQDGTGAERAVTALVEGGFEEASVLVIEGGLDAWRAAGYPTEVTQDLYC